jgi:hypothetical protein
MAHDQFGTLMDIDGKAEAKEQRFVRLGPLVLRAPEVFLSDDALDGASGVLLRIQTTEADGLRARELPDEVIVLRPGEMATFNRYVCPRTTQFPTKN